jgi:predicted dehydrogenase
VTIVFDDCRAEKLVVEDREGCRPISLDGQAPLQAELAHFANAIVSGRPFETPFEEGVAVVRVLLAGRRSLDSGGAWVDVWPADWLARGSVAGDRIAAQ